jgi:uncharacterized protein (TIGR02466 family)
MKIMPEECQIILEEGKKCRIKSNDYRSHLAGHLSEEYKITHEKEIFEWLKKYFEAYVTGYQKWKQGENKSSTLKLTSLWINYMKAGDFNPPHNHGGDLSFVIYPDMPEKIIKENKAFKGRDPREGPGVISWIYGERNNQCINVVNRLPETGDIFIFPATLNHWVFPFKSKVERISVSGNILCEKGFFEESGIQLEQ